MVNYLYVTSMIPVPRAASSHPKLTYQFEIVCLGAGEAIINFDS